MHIHFLNFEGLFTNLRALMNVFYVKGLPPSTSFCIGLPPISDNTSTEVMYAEYF